MSEQARDAVASITIAAPHEKVWEALTDPALIEQYFLGTKVTTTWQVGDPITYAGEYNGKPYHDTGTILAFDPPKLLRTTHYSPSSGLPDIPENHHTVEYSVTEHPAGAQDFGLTTVTITQGNNSSQQEVEQSTATWQLVLQNLKEFLETRIS
ncbi:SRPBCC domain-containing protein [Paenarthrobacter aurescens]|uniref:ATPase n=1 Tax=Paenarthrobacter aurescens TaxID=43663 RepID=A0A4Y3NGH4_PAEAU|nr:SRPBCC domain-containing protein [Paenarthrobacter aurescens]UKA48068.1 SRPBCC domain-containing protein [Arthrobacter sp. FW305-123]MDO6143829.1 SRPBCC domain-containing protein [Paenarthrobacter aurescens]MDO6147676.1 SRPBCC domain-containing protein [Paenarthrobacter aurescens]MDO6158920.1 SRPBCC domain-containing protein [Paenarthrobacter aurescens]MDO6162904.1 SRPBCC domain-containing protein [Paenarthrobacter aurescens]